MVNFKNMFIYFCLVIIFGFYSNPASARYLMDPSKAVNEDLDNIAKLPTNTTKLVKTVKNDVGDLTDSTVKGLTGDEGVNAQGGIPEDYNNKKNLRIAASKFAEVDATNADILKNPDKYTTDQKDAALQTFNQYAADEFGVKNTNGVSGYTGTNFVGKPEDKAISNGEEINKSNLDGLYDKDNKKIGINEANQDGSTEKLTKTDGHELNHYLQDINGRDKTLTPKQQEAGSNRLGDQLYNALSDEVGPCAPANADHQAWLDNQDFTAGNAQAAEAKNIEAWGAEVHYGSKELGGTKQWAKDTGMSAKDAETVAQSCENVDSISSGTSYLPVVGDQSYHFNTNGDPNNDSRQKLADEHLQKAIEYKNISNELKQNPNENVNLDPSKIYEDLSLKELGMGLHPLQDEDAHSSEFVSKEGFWYTHTNAKGNGADNPYVNSNKVNLTDEKILSNRFLNTKSKTKEYIKTYLEQTK